MRAGLYARVSREEQLEGYSIDAQLEAMRRFCKDRGWDIAAEYVEPGVSGTTTNRPAFQEAMADCEAGKLDALLTHQLDRFHRNLRHQLDTFSKLAEWKVAYVSVTEQIDYSTPQGMLFLQMLGAFNEYYVANLRREVRKGKRGRARIGKSNASVVPHGYRREENRDVPEPESAATVQLMFEEYATNSYSLQGLAEWLNQKGHPASGASRGLWTRQSVRYVLTNPFYTGWVRHGEELYPGQHEPIIEHKVFDEVQRVMEERSRVRARKPTGLIYLLQGIAYCSHCHQKMYAERHRWGRYYRCSSAQKGIICQARYVRADPVEEQVISMIRALHLPRDWRARIMELAENPEERAQTERTRKRLEMARKRLWEQYRWDIGMTEAYFHSERAKIQRELESLVMPEVLTLETLGSYLESLGDIWDDLTLTEQQDALRTMLTEVHIDALNNQVISVQFHKDFVPLIEQVRRTDEYQGGEITENPGGGLAP